MRFLVYIAFCFFLFRGEVKGQIADFPMSVFSTDNFTAQNWNQVGDVMMHPESNRAKIKSGKSIWLSSKTGANLKTVEDMGEIKLRFQLMQSQLADLSLILQNSYKISFNNSYGKNMNFMGGISWGSQNQIQASVNASKAIGLWNTIELIFIPSQNGEAAILELLQINGVRIHSNVFLPPTETTVNHLAFVNNSGTNALGKLEYLRFENKRPLSISNITYSVKEDRDWNRNYDKSADGVVNGKIESITHELPHDYKQYQTIYEGELNVEEDGYFAFTLDFAGRGKLFINDEEIVGVDNNVIREPQTGIKQLNKGTHKIQYVYQKIWWPAQVGLYLSGSDFRPYPVHSARSLSSPQLPGGIFIEPQEDRPQIVRGFMMHQGEKRTEVVTVGDKVGIHYSLDLEKGTLLHLWRGDFADVTEMWYNRGEPQLLKPLGLKANLNAPKLAYDAYMSDLQFDKYTLNELGYPTFHFKLGDAHITKSFKPLGDRLKVEISTKTSQALSIVLAAGDEVQDLGENVYKINETYYKVNSKNIEIVEMDQQQLVYHTSGDDQKLEYEIIW